MYVCMRVVCSVNTVCAQYVYSMYTVCLQYVYIMSTACLQHVYSMWEVCVVYVHSMSTACLKYVYSMYAGCPLGALWMCTGQLRRSKGVGPKAPDLGPQGYLLGPFWHIFWHYSPITGCDLDVKWGRNGINLDRPPLLDNPLPSFIIKNNFYNTA